MALIDISETQLAFGYLHSFLNVNRRTRFMLPSIRQEGGRVRFPFPGADLILNNNHLIQFKRPFLFTTSAIKEFWNYDKPTDINPPYFRFYIKNDDPTNQLQKLVDATNLGLTAEYISPLFSEESQFFALMGNDVNHLQSYAHIDIAQFAGMLGTIGNNNDHTVLYTVDSVNGGFCYCFSKPKLIQASKKGVLSSEDKNSRKFMASELLPKLRNTFFSNSKNDDTLEKPHYFSLCRELQQKLFIERNILWTFSPERLR